MMAIRDRRPRFKRGNDLVVEWFNLQHVLLSWAGRAVGILLTMGRFIFPGHLRPGLQALPNMLPNFRTMLKGVDSASAPLPDAVHVTRFGAFVRSSNLDRRPERWNVLRRERNLVEPCPLEMRYLNWHSRKQARHLLMPPSITSVVRVTGRNAISWDENLECDIDDADRWSLWRATKIMARTIVQTFGREGAGTDVRLNVSESLGGSGAFEASHARAAVRS